MTHSFDTAIARQCGSILEAVILRHIEFWLRKNIANERHIHDGKVWTYSSINALCELFPEATAKQIRSAMEKLERNGYIQVGFYNSVPTDRTKWYTLTDKYFSICPDGQMELPKWANGITQTGECIYKDTYIKHIDINKDIIKSDDDFEKFWDMYDRKVAKPQCERMWSRLTKEQRAEIFERLPAYIAATPDKQYRMHPATYINPANRRWQDEIIARKNENITRNNEGDGNVNRNTVPNPIYDRSGF